MKVIKATRDDTVNFGLFKTLRRRCVNCPPVGCAAFRYDLLNNSQV
jgi:hypothetical protein